jgi:hypothetical protein
MNIKGFNPEIKFGPEANANINPTRRNLFASTQGNDLDKLDKLTLKTNVVKFEEEKNNDKNITIKKRREERVKAIM